MRCFLSQGCMVNVSITQLSPESHKFTDKFYQTFTKKLISILSNLPHIAVAEETLYMSSCELETTLTSNPGRWSKRPQARL